MIRLIDADVYLKKVCTYNETGCGSCRFQTKCPADEPTIDAVEVVRCKDCKWGKEVCGNIECWIDMNLPPEYHGYYWYCPNGEKKEE